MLVIGVKTNFTVMALISSLPAVRTLVIGFMVISRVKYIILHRPVLFIMMVISAIIILTNTVYLRQTKAKFTLANVRMISATDWVNSSPPRGKFIKGCFRMVNTLVHLQRSTEVRCCQKPGVKYDLFLFKILSCMLFKFCSGISFCSWILARSNPFPSLQGLY